MDTSQRRCQNQAWTPTLIRCAQYFESVLIIFPGGKMRIHTTHGNVGYCTLDLPQASSPL